MKPCGRSFARICPYAGGRSTLPWSTPTSCCTSASTRSIGAVSSGTVRCAWSSHTSCWTNLTTSGTSAARGSWNGRAARPSRSTNRASSLRAGQRCAARGRGHSTTNRNLPTGVSAAQRPFPPIILQGEVPSGSCLRRSSRSQTRKVVRIWPQECHWRVVGPFRNSRTLQIFLKSSGRPSMACMTQ